jgi:autophagy-related protein 101
VTNGQDLGYDAFAYLFIPESALEERSMRRAALEQARRDVLFQIIKFVNEKDHIPPVPNLEGVTFPYEITIPKLSSILFTS